VNNKQDPSLKYIFVLLSSFLGYGIGILIKKVVNSEDEAVFVFFSTSFATALLMFLCDTFILPTLTEKIERWDEKRKLKHKNKMIQIKREMRQAKTISLSDENQKFEATTYQNTEIIIAQISKGRKI
jgi:hypothetical protein